MKKIYLIGLAMLGLVALQANAQEEVDNTFQFQDADGNEVKDGSIITLSTLTQNGQGQDQISTGLYIKNVSGDQAAGSLSIDISEMPEGSSFISCAFGSCLPAWTAKGVYESSSSVVAADALAENIATEWMPATYGEWTATMQLEVRRVSTNRFGVATAGPVTGFGPKVTLHFVYTDPTGIHGVTTTENKKVAAVYSAGGAKLTGMQPGINIVRYTDGTTAKVMK